MKIKLVASSYWANIIKNALKFICTETKFSMLGGMPSEPLVSTCFAYKCSEFQDFNSPYSKAPV